MKYIILGGGVAGLVSAFYLPEHYLITDKIGGWQNRNTFQLGPRLLEVTQATTTFLKKLNLPTNEKKINIGYRIGDFTSSSKNENFAKQYALKTRDQENVDAVLSGNKDVLTVFDIEYDLILKKLEDKVKDRIILDKITSIDLENKKVNIVKYPDFPCCWDEMVNTLPINLFCNLSKFDLQRDFTAFHTTFVKVKPTEYTKFFYRVYDYIYSIDTVWHRCNIFKDHAVLEIKGKFDPQLQYQIEYNGFEILDKITIPFAQMKYSYKDLTQIIPSITNVGRYACWDHSIKMEQIIEQYERTKTNI
jgi:hypothetical protein